MTDERPNPCIVTGCSMLTEPIQVCKDHRCPHRWTKKERLDRAARQAKDAKKKVGEMRL